MEINSREYWNSRFNTNWKEYGGEKQTAFFAHLLCDMLPEKIAREIRYEQYSVCDMGCALGEAIPIYSNKLSVRIDGMDFSEDAIKQCTEKYSNSHFWVGDLLNLSSTPQYDVVICSNVLEHFVNPWEILNNLTKVAQKYVIVMVPYREQLEIDEHEYKFDEDKIPLTVGEFSLYHVDVINGANFEESYYPDRQILMIYKKNLQELSVLGDLCNGVVKTAEELLRSEHTSLMEDKEKKNQELVSELKEQIRTQEEQIRAQEEQIRVQEAQLNSQREQICLQEEKLQEQEEQLNSQNKTLQKAENEIILLQEKAQILQETEAILVLAETAYIQACRSISAARSTCYNINSKTSYKIMCACIRFIRQFIAGPMSEKKKFLGICKRAILRQKSEFTGNDGYNMILNVANLLEVPPYTVKTGIKAPEHTEIGNVTNDMTEIIVPQNLCAKTAKCLSEKYNKVDIIMLSVINYDFRFQRPQHFASRFAQNGHRVFYVNANFVNKDQVKQIEKNLYTIDLFCENCNAIYYAPEYEAFDNWFTEKLDGIINEYAIRDAIIVIDYPNWIYGAEYLRKKYGFNIAVDYMDDFTGFLGTTTNVLKDNCIHMLETSDLVVASSQFLCDIATKYAKKIAVVRNGTEVEHFYQAVSMEEHRKRPVIGYYGAVSHWFAWEKVCYLAENMPECDIVIIGEVTDHREKLEKHKNIKLLGEKNYTELPKHLAYFDVCLIPFDTSTDLIKATNPVKFYEYLSAGKRIVATEIPELEPYRDEYVYMSNDDEQFLEYVRLCLSGNDTLKEKDECIAFARENDWQVRYECFAEACISAVPMVSIVVLTYNNLELNKYCIESILNKTAYPNYELIILDNMSTDGTVEYLKELDAQNHPQVKVILNDENSGFAGGNNKAIEMANGEFIMLLNNDTVVTRGWLTSGVKHMQNDENCGMCGAVTNSIGNEAMIGVNYHNLTELDSFAYQYTSFHNNEKYTDIDRLAMFCTLIRKSIMDEYAMLDDSYQVGMFEDDDYAMVVKNAGYEFYIVEDLFVHHVNNASFKKLESEEYKAIFEKNKAYFEKKWSTKWEMPKYREGVTAHINQDMMVEPKV